LLLETSCLSLRFAALRFVVCGNGSSYVTRPANTPCLSHAAMFSFILVYSSGANSWEPTPFFVTMVAKAGVGE